MRTRPAIDALAALGRAGADLALGSGCAGCGAPAALLCPGCRDLLGGPARVVRDESTVAGLPMTATAGYDDVGAVIIGHKEHGRLPLAAALGDALAVAVTALADVSGNRCAHADAGVLLVPVPSSRSAVRRRGQDPTARMARRAARTLRRSALPAQVVPALRLDRTVQDQAGLGRLARERNLGEAMSVRRTALRLLAGRCVVLVDDVVTTGATVREGVRALRTVGVEPCGVGAVAVTDIR